MLDLTEPGVVDDVEAVKQQVKIAGSMKEACEDAEAVVICTEWDEFRDATAQDWDEIYRSMKKPAFVFDGRGIVDAKVLRSVGFKVHAVGKGPLIVDPIWA